MTAEPSRYALRFVFEPQLILERNGEKVEVPPTVGLVAMGSHPVAQIWLTGAVTAEAMERAIESEVRGMCIDVAASADFKRAMVGIGLAFRRWVEEQR